MWERWDGPATRQDLSRTQELGVNTVRVMVPYKPVNGWTDKDTGAVNPVYLNELQQFVQMAGDLNMKVIITLFDFYDPSEDNPAPGNAADIPVDEAYAKLRNMCVAARRLRDKFS